MGKLKKNRIHKPNSKIKKEGGGGGGGGYFQVED